MPTEATMRDTRTLGPWLRRFLVEYIVTERNLARNTQKSYRDTFALLLPFVSARIRKPVDRLAIQDLTARRVRQFLAHLEEERRCSVQTRNQRLTAIRAFARFRRQPRSCPSRMECQRALDCSEEDRTASDRMAEQERDGGIAEGSPAQDPARPNRIRPAAVPLQQRSTRLGSDTAASKGSAD